MNLKAQALDPQMKGLIKLAVMAVGGQGGGVLTSWIEAVAQANGYAVQATSVAGVAQRTGATIYYIEMAPDGERAPVFSLAPAAGDVDILIAAEMIEAGRAILRGFVTPDRTTLITSTHRSLAVSEKMVPGDGTVDSRDVRVAAEAAAQRLIMFDMEKVAVDSGSVISSSLFGALAGSGALPFARETFEEAIRASGKGVETSLAAFGQAFSVASNPETPAETVVAAGSKKYRVQGSEKLLQNWHLLLRRIQEFPTEVQEITTAGLHKVVDFQDLDYGQSYLDRLDRVLGKDHAHEGFRLTREAAKYIANAMAYDDVIRVADLKTRGNRFQRVRGEMGVSSEALMKITEFMHPRAEELVGLLPVRWGRKIEAQKSWMERIEHYFCKGRRLRTDSFFAFALLYLLGGLRGWRLRSLRHATEIEHMERWLSVSLGYLDQNYALAVEVLRCRRIVKGYSDTHARGLSKFDRVLEGIALVSARKDSADWASRLREAALKDEKGEALDGALKTIRSFV
ncbi:indolepyruvate oxidoreductase subunit beta family protein [Kiloniella laminariae]|uniref:Indolepyruvate oxidoreductase subunit beta family protein n=1 Tax=Kiloniella laminariae TaxID=454162 RepID=A0ABT4LN94_9PROT|nr:indolepyruvate oxidoreductase subunit beta family protein [Kiloniella laminariae]MCZ4282558.1 indolepyruvate oxidoreductase subunit beta family protein [Kiloniella laminariae]